MYVIRDTISYVLMNIFNILPLKDKAVFISFYGEHYSDSPKVMYEQMKKDYPQIEYVWIMKDPDSVKIDAAKVVKAKSIKAAYHYATSKLWVSSTRLRGKMAKRKKQFYVQTWHAVINVKKVEKDAEEKISKSYVKDAKRDSKLADLFLSGSKFCSENYRDAFWYDGKILELGLPREDLIYQDKSIIKNKINNHFRISNDTKIALYVPTFRVDKKTNCYDLDYNIILKSIKKRWGGDWKILVRLHPNIVNMQNELTYNDDVINATDYDITNELIKASDIVITDYSSCMCSGLQSDAKVFLYAKDIEEYKKDRGTYFDLTKLPFPLAKTTDELCEKIENFNEDEYYKEANVFKEKLGFCNSADSTKKVNDYIVGRIDWKYNK